MFFLGYAESFQGIFLFENLSYLNITSEHNLNCLTMFLNISTPKIFGMMKKLHLKERPNDNTQERNAANTLNFDNVFASINPDAFNLETERTRNPFGHKPEPLEEVPDSPPLYREPSSPDEDDERPRSIVRMLQHPISIVCFLCVFLGALNVWHRSSTDTVEPAALAPQGSESAQNTLSGYVKQKFSAFSSADSIHKFVKNSKVNGVLLDAENSAITLNGTTFRSGDVVSGKFELQFVGFAKSPERAIFQGPDGLRYSKRIP